MATMQMSIVIPAVASLAPFATNPTSARIWQANALHKAQVEMSGGDLPVSDAAYTFRTFASYPARQRRRHVECGTAERLAWRGQ